jgi:rod shape-determining protein MreC
MESVLGRYRNLVILVGVLFLQVLGLAMQVKRSSSEAQDTRLIRIWAVGAITPFERGLNWIERGSGNLWHNYFYLRGVRAENRQLKAEIEQMRLEQVRLSEDAAQARRLQTVLAFKEQFISRTVAAQVIGASGSDLSRVVYIDKGENVGLKRDMAVITSDGIVGKILTVYPNVSQVLLINDQSSGVGAILENTRLQGVLRGTTNGEVVLERVMSDEQVPVGENLLTSGGDQIFPKGLPVGTVTKVGSGKDLFLNIKVKPAANLSKLEEVLVLVEKQERQATAEDAVHVRAADILAQRLPSVPDKPVTPAATVVPGASVGTNGTVTGAPNPSAKPQTPSATPKVAGNAGSGIQLLGTPVNAAPGTPASQKKTSVPTGGTASSPSESSETKPPSRPKPISASPPKPVPAQTNPQPAADPGAPQ